MTTLLLSVMRGPNVLSNQICTVASGAFAIGRAQPSDWVLEDPRRVPSKRHGVLWKNKDGRSVADVSGNGSIVARGGEGKRLGDRDLALDLRKHGGSFLTISPSPRRAPQPAQGDAVAPARRVAGLARRGDGAQAPDREPGQDGGSGAGTAVVGCQAQDGAAIESALITRQGDRSGNGSDR